MWSFQFLPNWNDSSLFANGGGEGRGEVGEPGSELWPAHLPPPPPPRRGPPPPPPPPPRRSRGGPLPLPPQAGGEGQDAGKISQPISWSVRARAGFRR